MIQRYEKYIDSGIEWIGEIPEGWKVKKLKYVTEINPTKDHTLIPNLEKLVTFLPMEKVGENGEIDCEIKKPIFDLWTGFTFFKKNDVIVAKITPCFENGKGALLNNLETEIGFGSTEFHVLRAKKKLDPRFLYYITKSAVFMKVGEAFMTGSAGQKRVPTDFISEFLLAFPNILEQTAIATFLDRKTAELDQLIANKEKLIALYEEEKVAIISQAVTRGLDLDVKLKPSGIEWVGDIPEHWEVKKLSYCFLKIGSGTTPTAGKSEYYENGQFNWLQTGDLNDEHIYETSKKITQQALNDYTTLRFYPVDSIVIAMYGATIGKVGLLKNCYIYKSGVLCLRRTPRFVFKICIVLV